MYGLERVALWSDVAKRRITMKPETDSDASVDWPEPRTELGAELIALAKEINAPAIPRLTLDEIEEYLGRERDCDSFEELVEPISQSLMKAR